MLEEKNDNLQDADGNVNNEATNRTTTPTDELESETEPNVQQQGIAHALESTNDVVNAITDVNAAESEDATLIGRHEIPMEDYEAMTLEELVSAMQTLVENDKVMVVKEHIEEVKKSFLFKFNHLLDEKREEFNANNADNTEEFKYDLPIKNKFDSLYNQFKDIKSKHFKSLQNDLKGNLENRLAIVEELKNLVQNSSSISSSLKQLNEIRERWKNAGPIPKDKYNHVWNNYHFHIENFYDFLHLDREARDQDFKYNLDLKLKIIERVEELVEEEDIKDRKSVV